jgi:hypothetical protein
VRSDDLSTFSPPPLPSPTKREELFDRLGCYHPYSVPLDDGDSSGITFPPEADPPTAENGSMMVKGCAMNT